MEREWCQGVCAFGLLTPRKNTPRYPVSDGSARTARSRDWTGAVEAREISPARNAIEKRMLKSGELFLQGGIGLGKSDGKTCKRRLQ